MQSGAVGCLDGQVWDGSPLWLGVATGPLEVQHAKATTPTRNHSDPTPNTQSPQINDLRTRKTRASPGFSVFVAGVGFEPTTFGL